MNENFLDGKLEEREKNNSLRSLFIPGMNNDYLVDFCSNDYLGIVKNGIITSAASGTQAHGSTGSRLLSGNYKLIEDVESEIAGFHCAQAGLIFNSGYDANLGLLSAVPQKNDAIIYDQLSHASLRDGVRLSFADAYSFLHNDLDDLQKKLANARDKAQTIFVVTESIFSMDGDEAPLIEMQELCENFGAQLIIDEAHATGVTGEKGEGLVQQAGLENKIFARVHTFGKACGAHGAIVLGSSKLKKYLVNFARPFIFSTSLSPAAIEAIRISYQAFPAMQKERQQLQALIECFTKTSKNFKALPSNTPIQIAIMPGNDAVKKMAALLSDHHFDIRPILYPTVPRGQERLRIVLHAFNTVDEVEKVLSILNENV